MLPHFELLPTAPAEKKNKTKTNKQKTKKNLTSFLKHRKTYLSI
jgi:hypothetical protein